MKLAENDDYGEETSTIGNGTLEGEMDSFVGSMVPDGLKIC